MVDELTLRDVLQQIGARLGRVEDDIRASRTEVGARLGRVEESVRALRAEMNARLEQVQEQFRDMRAEMDRRFGWVTGLLVTVLLALVVGIGGLWLK